MCFYSHKEALHGQIFPPNLYLLSPGQGIIQVEDGILKTTLQIKNKKEKSWEQKLDSRI